MILFQETKLKTENATPWVRRGLIVLAWAAIAQFGYSASLKHTEVKVEFDPFVIMGIEDRKDELSDWEASKKGSFQILLPKISVYFISETNFETIGSCQKDLS